MSALGDAQAARDRLAALAASWKVAWREGHLPAAATPLVAELLRALNGHDIHDLIERSSLGTPAATAARASVSDEDAARVMGRARELGGTDGGQGVAGFRADANNPGVYLSQMRRSAITGGTDVQSRADGPPVSVLGWGAACLDDHDRAEAGREREAADALREALETDGRKWVTYAMVPADEWDALHAALDEARAQRDQSMAWNKRQTEEFTSTLANVIASAEAEGILAEHRGVDSIDLDAAVERAAFKECQIVASGYGDEPPTLEGWRRHYVCRERHLRDVRPIVLAALGRES